MLPTISHAALQLPSRARASAHVLQSCLALASQACVAEGEGEGDGEAQQRKLVLEARWAAQEALRVLQPGDPVLQPGGALVGVGGWHGPFSLAPLARLMLSRSEALRGRVDLAAQALTQVGWGGGVGGEVCVWGGGGGIDV